MKEDITASDMLIEQYGKKESYTYFEAVEAMIKYAAIRSDVVIDRMMEMINVSFKSADPCK